MGINLGVVLFVVVYIYFMNGNVYEGMSNLIVFIMFIVVFIGVLFGVFFIYFFVWKGGINLLRLLFIGIGVNIVFILILMIF